VAPVAGCDGSRYPEDDNEHEHEWSDESGGCGGDEYDDGESDDVDSGGCEGDDVDDSAESTGDSCGGCEGDAIASAPGRPIRRSPIIARLVGWTPWLTIFVALRLMRRRRRA